jgi:hypothetical protein
VERRPIARRGIELARGTAVRDIDKSLHAVGSVLMGVIFDVVAKKDDGGDINAKYGRELAALTAVSSDLLTQGSAKLSGSGAN